MRRFAFLLVVVSLACLGRPARADDAPRLGLDVGGNPTRAVSGKPVVLQVTLQNVAEGEAAGPLAFHVPEFAGVVPFPHWVLEHEDGSRYTPHTPSFQSEWQQGLQGEIVTLSPGAGRRFATSVRAVVGDGEREGDARPLPPGRYTVTCRHAKADARVPYGHAGFRREMRAHPGLWTGTVASEPFTLVVAPSDEPVLEIEVAEAAVPGEAYPLGITLRNDGPEPLRVEGAFVVTIGMKARAWGAARLVHRDGVLVPAAGNATGAVGLLPGAAVSGTIDLSTLTFRETRRGETLEHGFADLAPGGLFQLTVRFEDAAGEPVAGAGVHRRTRPLATAPTPLRLSLERVDDGARTPTVDVVLSNAGNRPVRVPATLAYPENLYFAITLHEDRSEDGPVHRIKRQGGLDPFGDAPEPGPEAKIGGGMAWDGNAFEPRRDWRTASTVLLAPGGEIRRRVNLGDLVADGALLEWTTQVTAYYRNRESGRRLGLDDLFVGKLRSETLTVKGRGW